MSGLLRIAALTLTVILSSATCIADDSETLMEIDRQFSAMAQEDIAAAFDHYLAADAQSLGENYFGNERKDIVGWFHANAGQLQMRWWPIGALMAESNDLGYTWGRYIEHQSQDDGSVQEIHGKYLTIWQKDHSGEWKSVIDMGATNPPPEK